MSEDQTTGDVDHNPLDEPDEPDPWDDTALVELDGRRGEEETVSSSGDEPQTVEKAAESPSVEDEPPAPEATPVETEPPVRQPFPAWAVEELRALRRELVALEQMIEALGGEPLAADASLEGQVEPLGERVRPADSQDGGFADANS